MHVKAQELTPDFVVNLQRQNRNKRFVVLAEDDYKAMEKAQRNAEYLAKLDESWRQFDEGKCYSYSMDDLYAFADGKLTPDEFRALGKEQYRQQSA